MSERHFTSIREQDLEIAASARDVIDSSEDFFVLTGSYSIEALAKGEVTQYDDAMVDESGLRFKLPDNSGNPVIVPTVMETLAINDMWSEEFRVTRAARLHP